MINVFICVMITLLVLICYTLMPNILKTNEHFYASSCQDLKSENGLICSIPNSPLYSNKCYKVRQSIQNPDGEYEHINVYDCTSHPDCGDIGEKCGTKNIAKLGNGYIERW